MLRGVRLTLCLVLSLVATAKLAWLSLGGAADQPWAHKAFLLLIGVVEVTAAALLMWKRTAAWVPTAIAWGFLGAGVVTGLRVVTTPDPMCRCLGFVEIPLVASLVIQGIVVALAGLLTARAGTAMTRC